MSYVDRLLDEVNRECSRRHAEVIGGVFEKIARSMAGLTSLSQYVSLKVDAHWRKKMHEAILDNDPIGYRDYRLMRYYRFDQNRAACERILNNARLNGHGMRHIRKEILLAADRGEL